ncbi:MAG: protein-export chaperone SecB [Gammaproteobacteria bacterium]|nr:protein-export chaperone SecB [Gammaproteobacteria bacterium]
MSEAAKQADGDQQPQLVIQKIYTKDLSFETPNSPQVFSQEWKPNVNLNIATDNVDLGNEHYEVTVSVTVTAKVGENTAFLAEVKQAGIFGIRGLEPDQLKQTLGAYCANVLFPYAREVVSDLIIRGGFPQLNIAPVNFDALYLQQLQQAQQRETDAAVPLQ